jgi:hypothetical protein
MARRFFCAALPRSSLIKRRLHHPMFSRRPGKRFRHLPGLFSPRCISIPPHSQAARLSDRHATGMETADSHRGNGSPSASSLRPRGRFVACCDHSPQQRVRSPYRGPSLLVLMPASRSRLGQVSDASLGHRLSRWSSSDQSFKRAGREGVFPAPWRTASTCCQAQQGASIQVTKHACIAGAAINDGATSFCITSSRSSYMRES